MRIVCPSCSAAYDVPEGLLIGRKSVRCARCTKEWEPAGTPPPVAIMATPVAMPTAPRPVVDGPPVPQRRSADLGAMAIDRLMATPQPKQRSGVALGLAWLASIVLVAALLAAAYAERATVMAVWPASARLYAALGLAGPTP
jgi:predicted Zn finger-like uncharacterized protein